MAPVLLTEWTTCGGCAAKWGAAPLSGVVEGLAEAAPDLLVGLAPFDDAAVYRVSDELALVSTTDFFPPLVDDPADFGAIAAANACSDVFAMGGRVALALNISAFPERLPIEAVQAILGAAASTVAEAGGVVAGGHTIRSDEPIFGLAVQGFVHPAQILTKGGARPGDQLVLSKPIGTGIVLAGGSADAKGAAVAGMRRLNREASERLVALQVRGGAGPGGGAGARSGTRSRSGAGSRSGTRSRSGAGSRDRAGPGGGTASGGGTEPGGGAASVHAVTDVTGFGLAGHAWEMAERSGARLRLRLDQVPLYPEACDLASTGVRTGGDARNREHLAGRVTGSVEPGLEALAYDPQTSGGLLAAVSPELVAQLVGHGFVEIGEVVAGDPAVELSAG
jgi:selenide,water dikinase